MKLKTLLERIMGIWYEKPEKTLSQPLKPLKTPIMPSDKHPYGSYNIEPKGYIEGEELIE